MTRETARRLAACCVLAGLTLLAQAAEAPGGEVVVLAASSLTDVLNDIAERYERETGAHVALSYAASSALARQIEAGAPADLFFSADADWMDYLQKHELIQTPSRRTSSAIACVSSLRNQAPSAFASARDLPWRRRSAPATSRPVIPTQSR